MEAIKERSGHKGYEKFKFTNSDRGYELDYTRSFGQSVGFFRSTASLEFEEPEGEKQEFIELKFFNGEKLIYFRYEINCDENFATYRNKNLTNWSGDGDGLVIASHKLPTCL